MKNSIDDHTKSIDPDIRKKRKEEVLKEVEYLLEDIEENDDADYLWSYLSSEEDLPLEVMTKYADKLDWTNIAIYQQSTLPISFLIDNMEKIDWQWLKEIKWFTKSTDQSLIAELQLKGYLE